jgi:hypothetical protein
MKVSKEKEKQLLVLCGCLPVLADFIEDLNMEYVFSKNIKRKANMLMEEIRLNDERILKNTDSEIHTQQVDIQIAFRQWIKNNFN